jgi:hypothetical protein
VTHSYNPSYSRSRDQEDHDSKPAWADCSRDPISNILNTKRAVRVSQVIEHLPSKNEALSSKPTTEKKKKRI